MKTEYKPIYKNDIRLNSPQQVNRLLSKVTNALLKDEIEESRAKSVTYICNTILKAQELGQLEDRLKRLEEVLSDE